QELGELRALVTGRRVDVEQLADLGECQSEPLAAQDQFDPCALALAVDPRSTFAARRKQPLVFVESDRSRGEREFLGKVVIRIGVTGTLRRRPSSPDRIVRGRHRAGMENRARRPNVTIAYCFDRAGRSEPRMLRHTKSVPLTADRRSPDFAV